MQPDPRALVEAIDLEVPILGVYDAPDPQAFAPLIEPIPGRRACSFAFWRRLVKGETLHLTPENPGCGGVARAWFGVLTRTREEYLRFLVEDEGLKASEALMGEWFDKPRPQRCRSGHALFGPLRPEAWDRLLSVVFLVNPDQLGALAVGAQYHARGDDPIPVIAPFGAGCGLLVPFDDPSVPQGAIGGTDLAMRRYLPPDRMTFAATRPMFERLCSLGERSFLHKPFLRDLRRARGGSIAGTTTAPGKRGAPSR